MNVHCPKCNSDQAHRSHRKGIQEYAASFAARKPYRCAKCGHRFLIVRPAAEKFQATGPEKEIRGTRSAAQWKRKRRELVAFSLALLLFAVFLYYLTRLRPNIESDAPSSTLWPVRITIILSQA